MRRPDPSEHHEYYERYVRLVPDGDLLQTLERQMEETQALLASVGPARERHRYAPGKWSVCGVVSHLIDAERVFAFRCLWIARAGEGELPSMDQDAWAGLSRADDRPLPSLAEEWALLRRDTLAMYRSFPEEAWSRRGRASGRIFSARSLPWIVAGHELWHRAGLVRDYGIGAPS